MTQFRPIKMFVIALFKAGVISKNYYYQLISPVSLPLQGVLTLKSTWMAIFMTLSSPLSEGSVPHNIELGH